MRGHREVPKNPPTAAHGSRLLPYKQPIFANPLESTLPQVLILNNLKSFGINTYTKTRGRSLPGPPFPTPSYSKGNTPRLDTFRDEASRVPQLVTTRAFPIFHFHFSIFRFK